MDCTWPETSLLRRKVLTDRLTDVHHSLDYNYLPPSLRYPSFRCLPPSSSSSPSTTYSSTPFPPTPLCYPLHSLLVTDSFHPFSLLPLLFIPSSSLLQSPPTPLFHFLSLTSLLTRRLLSPSSSSSFSSLSLVSPSFCGHVKVCTV